MGIGRETNKKTHANAAVRSGRDEYEQDLAEEREAREQMLADLYVDDDIDPMEDRYNQKPGFIDDEDYYLALYEFNDLPIPQRETMTLGELLAERKLKDSQGND